MSFMASFTILAKTLSLNFDWFEIWIIFSSFIMISSRASLIANLHNSTTSCGYSSSLSSKTLTILHFSLSSTTLAIVDEIYFKRLSISKFGKASGLSYSYMILTIFLFWWISSRKIFLIFSINSKSLSLAPWDSMIGVDKKSWLARNTWVKVTVLFRKSAFFSTQF